MQLAQVQRRLASEFGQSVASDRVDRCVADATARFADAPVREFVPILVERAARRRLLAAADGHHLGWRHIDKGA